MEKKKNNLIPIVIILIVLVLGLGGFIVYDKVLNNNEDNSDGYTLNVFGSDFNSCSGENCSKIIYTIKTNTEEAKILRASDNFVLYNDIGLKVYDRKNDKVLNIELEPDYDIYSFHLSEDENKVIGIVAYSHSNNNGTAGFKNVYYNLSLNKKMYENKYYGLGVYNDNFLEAYDSEYPAPRHLLYIEKEEVLIDGDGGFLSLLNTKNSFYIIDSSLYYFNAIYTQNKKLIASKIESKNLTFYDDYLYILNNNNIQKYDVSGNLIETISKYKNPLGFIKGEKNYFAYIENNILKLQDMETEEIISIADWNDKYVFTNYSWYENFDEKRICIALEEKGTGQRNGIEYYYNLRTKEITTKKIEHGVFTHRAWD